MINPCAMKQITLNIQEDKYPFFIELIKSLDFVQVQGDFFVSDEKKEIVRERIKMSDKHPDRLLDWDEVKDSFVLD